MKGHVASVDLQGREEEEEEKVEEEGKGDRFDFRLYIMATFFHATLASAFMWVV